MGWAILPENVGQNNPFIGKGTRVTEVETQNPPHILSSTSKQLKGVMYQVLVAGCFTFFRSRSVFSMKVTNISYPGTESSIEIPMARRLC